MIESKFKLFLLFLVLIFGAVLQAQTNIYFINRAKNKVVEVKVGQILSLKYKGYLGQPEFVKETVTEITDSFVVLGVNPEILGAGFQKILSSNPKFIYKKVMLNDIVSFRRITAGRQLLRTSLMVANIIGIGYLLTDLYHYNTFTVPETLGISLGVGIVSSLAINIFFPENPKYFLNNGWIITTGFEKPKL